MLPKMVANWSRDLITLALILKSLPYLLRILPIIPIFSHGIPTGVPVRCQFPIYFVSSHFRTPDSWTFALLKACKNIFPFQYSVWWAIFKHFLGIVESRLIPLFMHQRNEIIYLNRNVNRIIISLS